MKTKVLIYPLFVLFAFTFIFSSCKDDSDEEPTDPTKGTVTDSNGNTYSTIKIGNQWWMSENLKTTSFRNGEDIPKVAGSGDWAATGEAAYCNYANDSVNPEVYGRLYNWYATVDGRKICPEGWHVPNNDNWTTLIEFLGGEEVAGGKLKQSGTEYWNSPNTDATNESGFAALPGGVRSPLSGFFAGLGTTGSWWSTSVQNANYSFVWGLTSASGTVSNYDLNKHSGLSVRCVKD